jgi:hypothetical protein
VAVYGPSGAYDNDPEQARDTKPEKAADIPGLRSPRQRPHLTVRSPGGTGARRLSSKPWRNGRSPTDCTPRRTLRRLRWAPCPVGFPRSAP